MSWNYNNMRKSFGWKKPNNGNSFNNPQFGNNNSGSNNSQWNSQPMPPAAYQPNSTSFSNQPTPFPPSQPSYDTTFATPQHNNGVVGGVLPSGQGSKESSSGTSTKTIVMVVVSVVIVLVALVGIFAGVAAANANGERDILFPNEVRSGNDYVGVVFLTEPSEAGFNAFVRAAERWSDILAGSEALIRQRTVSVACGNDFGFDIVTDHLRVFSSEVVIDGAGGVLGRAGFCDLQQVELPQFGNMEFDTVDINQLGDVFVEAVILHEMGHVLGIGTLWSFAGLEINPLPGDVLNLNLPQPFYIGAEGVAQFEIIKGSPQTQIGIENGFNERSFPQGVNGAGPGSIGGHFDKDDLDNELMTFAISNNPQLSIITIGSLEDLGYIVNLNLADNFVDPFPGQLVAGESQSAVTEDDLLYLHGDILVDDKYSFVEE